MVAMIVSVFDPLTDEARLVELPGQWVICERCEGDGTHSGGIVVTGDDMEQMFGQDFDARDEYVRSMRSGWYRCEECNGTGKTLTYADGRENYTEEQERLLMLHMEQEAERYSDEYWSHRERLAESGYAW